MKSDMEKAREIVRKHSPFVSGERLLESITKAVAEGIALGREERQEMTAPDNAQSPTASRSR
jgi:hypothetical protein